MSYMRLSDAIEIFYKTNPDLKQDFYSDVWHNQSGQLETVGIAYAAAYSLNWPVLLQAGCDTKISDTIYHICNQYVQFTPFTPDKDGQWHSAFTVNSVESLIDFSHLWLSCDLFWPWQTIVYYLREFGN